MSLTQKPLTHPTLSYPDFERRKLGEQRAEWEWQRKVNNHCLNSSAIAATVKSKCWALPTCAFVQLLSSALVSWGTSLQVGPLVCQWLTVTLGWTRGSRGCHVEQYMPHFSENLPCLLFFKVTRGQLILNLFAQFKTLWLMGKQNIYAEYRVDFSSVGTVHSIRFYFLVIRWCFSYLSLSYSCIYMHTYTHTLFMYKYIENRKFLYIYIIMWHWSE